MKCEMNPKYKNRGKYVIDMFKVYKYCASGKNCNSCIHKRHTGCDFWGHVDKVVKENEKI